MNHLFIDDALLRACLYRDCVMFPMVEEKDKQPFLEEIERLSRIQDNEIADRALSQMRDILSSLNQSKTDASSNSADIQSTSTSTFFSQGVYKSSDETFILNLRRQLYPLINDTKLTSILAESVLIHAFDLLLQLAIKMPINDSNFTTDDKLWPGRVVFTASGHRFDLEEITRFFIIKKSYVNPYFSTPFSLLDIHHIMDAIITLDASDESEAHTALMKSLGFPSGIAYGDGLLYLLDVKGKPHAILENSLRAIDLPETIKTLIRTKQNIKDALYNRLISIADIKAIPIDNLRSLGTYRKALLILQSADSSTFLQLLKTKNYRDIFKILNSADSHDAICLALSPSRPPHRDTIIVTAESTSSGGSCLIL